MRHNRRLPPRPPRPDSFLTRTWLCLIGAITGGICGFIVYWAGALILAIPDLMQMSRDAIPHEFARPIFQVSAWEIVLVAVGAIIGLTVARYRWRGIGLLSYISLASVIAGYIYYALTVSIPQVPPSERWLSYTLFVAEAGGLSLIAIFSFYSLDVATRRRWMRLAQSSAYDPSLEPYVALMVPVFNEEFEIVQQTVAHLVRQDYPRHKYQVLVLDDSTDADLRERLSAYCKEVGATYISRPNRKGFKAGAINNAERLLAKEYEFIAVIDADYWVQPHYVKSVVGYFTDTSLSFVQTPQDYRNLNESFLTRQYKRAEAYFYHAIMPSRNEQNAIIFCGTMGMLRRRAFQQVRGFAEDQICEDAEIAVRLSAAGWNSLYVDQSFGHGLMPAVFEAYKKQFHRWCFGNVKILFTHTGTILRSRMTRRQKFDYMVSNLHWFDGFFVIAIALILLYLGLGAALGYDAITHHQREIILLALVPMALIVDGAVRLHLVLRRSGNISFTQSLLVQGMWFSIKLTNVFAIIKCTLGFRTPFIRTPKAPGRRLGRIHSFFRATRLTFLESTLGATLFAVAVFNAAHARPGLENIGSVLLPTWMFLYAMFLLSAPIYAYLSYRTLAPMRYTGVPTGAPTPTVVFDAVPDDDPPPTAAGRVVATRA